LAGDATVPLVFHFLGRAAVFFTRSPRIEGMRELSPEEVDEVLVRNGVGVLSLTDGGQPYAVPMSFGYSGDEMTFPMQLGTGYDGRKERCIDSNSRACFTVYERTPAAEVGWRSVVATGRLREIPDDEAERAFSSLAANAEFARDLGVWGVPFEDVELTLYGLDIAECTGREFPPFDAT
jgi:nitroimidazol reductase NimA-like FMN-containing flavoprotein (pyridoxamine 5'-phosphate oxidase superfamily)